MDSFDRDTLSVPQNPMYVYGRNPVLELLRSGTTVEKIFYAKGDEASYLSRVFDLANKMMIPCVCVDRRKLDQLSENGNHQGIVALSSGISYYTLDELLAASESSGVKPFFVILDGVEDPHNLGAVIRTCECCGCNGVIIPKRRCAPVTSVVAKAAAGALYRVPIARVSNISQAIKKLKENNVWIYAADSAGRDYRSFDYSGPTALVMGSEGYGIADNVLQASDFTISIPLHGGINSLNVSAAAAVLLYAMEPYKFTTNEVSK